MRPKTWMLGLGPLGPPARCGDGALDRGATGGAAGAGLGEVASDEPLIGAGAGILTA